MQLTSQTQSDLERILETLDQRIHELTEADTTAAEQDALDRLRENTRVVLGE